MLSEEATHTNFIVFGLTRPVLEATIYRIRGEHANHYTTDALDFFRWFWLIDIQYILCVKRNGL